MKTFKETRAVARKKTKKKRSGLEKAQALKQHRFFDE